MSQYSSCVYSIISWELNSVYGFKAEACQYRQHRKNNILVTVFVEQTLKRNWAITSWSSTNLGMKKSHQLLLFYTWLQASAAKWLKTALFRVITRQVLVTYYYMLRKNPVHYYYSRLKERIYLQGLQDPSQTNGHNPNNVRRETSRYFTHRKRQFLKVIQNQFRSQWLLGLRRSSAAARLRRSWVRIPPGDMDVCLLWVLCVVR